jgi:neutral ceramidase
MTARHKCLGLILALLASPTLSAAPRGLTAGVARADITPETPIWLSGYAARKAPAGEVLQRLWAKALAIDDGRGGRIIVVTTDLIGLPRAVTEVVAARLMKAHSLARRQVLFNSSHTHTGPVVRPNLITMFDLNAEDRKLLDDYALRLTDALFDVTAAAIADLAPAVVEYGAGEVDFAVNRREFSKNRVGFGVNPAGPVDRSVPVIRVTSPDGKLRAVMVGYACHNTTLTAEFNQVSGDYAGFAQEAIEKSHPGATAMFMMLCGGDQNPNPRSTLDLARKHGASLAGEVERIMRGKLIPVAGPVRSAFEVTELEFAPHTREQFEEELTSTNPSVVRRAQAMLKAYNERLPVRRTPYPVQAVRIGRELTIIALGGEVVVDYSLRAKKEFGAGTNLIVAGYSNDVMCYIPSRRILKEGGYEAVDSMIYYGQPGPFTDDVEDRVFVSIRRVMRRVGR